MITVADLFCGAGGTSTGLIKAAKTLGVPIDLIAVNHWGIAVKTHTLNHPWAKHLCADLSTIDPNKAVPSGTLDLLIASPECTHHSNARGGKPCSDQSRASAWHVLHWAERLNPKHILIENVREFTQWGPLGINNRPDLKRRGETFNAFKNALTSLGYEVDWRILNAADFGDATCRHRMFLQASRLGPITWPCSSHAGKWRPAKDIIDWDIKGESIFERKRALKPKTLDRIEAGLRKFGGEPFIAILRGTDIANSGSWAKSVDDPLGAISTSGAHHALCEPFLIPMEHSGRNPVRSTDKPLPTITTAKGGSFGLCEPFLVSYHAGRNRPANRVHSQHDPLPTIDTENRFGLCQPFLTKYYGTASGAMTVEAPLDTITSKDRFALCQPMGMDIRFRMLQPHELAEAMGLDDYLFCGTKTQVVKQIGNAVFRRTAQALCSEILPKL